MSNNKKNLQALGLHPFPVASISHLSDRTVNAREKKWERKRERKREENKPDTLN